MPWRNGEKGSDPLKNMAWQRLFNWLEFDSSRPGLWTLERIKTCARILPQAELEDHFDDKLTLRSPHGAPSATLK